MASSSETENIIVEGNEISEGSEGVNYDNNKTLKNIDENSLSSG